MERKEKLAVNLEGLDALSDELRVRLFAGRLNLQDIVRVTLDGRPAEYPSVGFCCPLAEAALVCDLIRSEDRKHGRPSTAIYLSRSGTGPWVRVQDHWMLTLVVAGKPHLNPAFFPDTAVPDCSPRVVVPLVRRK